MSRNTPYIRRVIFVIPMLCILSLTAMRLCADMTLAPLQPNTSQPKTSPTGTPDTLATFTPALDRQLQELALHEPTRAWSQAVRYEINRVSTSLASQPETTNNQPGPGNPTGMKSLPGESDEPIRQLHSLVASAMQLTGPLSQVDYPLACRLQQTKYAVQRRISCWQLASQLQKKQPGHDIPGSGQPTELLLSPIDNDTNSNSSTVGDTRPALNDIAPLEPASPVDPTGPVGSSADQPDTPITSPTESPITPPDLSPPLSPAASPDLPSPAASAPPESVPTAPAPAPDLGQIVESIDQLLGNSEEAGRWKLYLMLRELGIVAGVTKKLPEPVTRALTTRVLKRIDSPELTERQASLMCVPPIRALRAELVGRLARVVNAQEMLAMLERFEETGSAYDGDLLIGYLHAIALVGDSLQRETVRLVQSNYQNANLRFDISQQLLNLLVPEREVEYTRVREYIIGKPVQGDRWTDTDVAFKMVPNPNQIMLALLVNGTVQASTTSSSGPATFFNRSDSSYVGRKVIRLDEEGLHLSPAEVTVENDLQLKAVKTSLDIIPLIGSLASDFARSEHRRVHSRIREEVRMKVYNEAKKQIDNESDMRLGRIDRLLKEFVLQPLNELQLGPDMVEHRTTEQMLIARYRIAGEDQCGSYSPRPAPPINSLASMQLHQSSVNNFISRLELSGKTFTIAELRDHLAQKIGRTELTEASDAEPGENDDVQITFALRDPIALQFNDDRITIELGIRRLAKERRKWDDFRIRASYIPKIVGRAIWLEPNGSIQLIGASSPASQLALRGIFLRIFSDERPIRITPKALEDDQRLAGLAFNQFYINDGWISIALGTAQQLVQTPHAMSPSNASAAKLPLSPASQPAGRTSQY